MPKSKHYVSIWIGFLLLFLALPAFAFTPYNRQEIITLMSSLHTHIAYVKNADAKRGNQFDGQCVNYVKNARVDLTAAGVGGNAKYWSKNAKRQGFVVSRMPRVGAVYVDTRGRYGHIGIVTGLKVVRNRQGYLQYKLTVRDSNRKSRLKMRNNVDYVSFPSSQNFLFIHKTENEHDTLVKKARNVIAALYDANLLASNGGEGLIEAHYYQSDTDFINLIILLSSYQDYRLHNGLLDVLHHGFQKQLNRGAHVGEVKAYIKQLLLGASSSKLVQSIQSSQGVGLANLRRNTEIRIASPTQTADDTMIQNTLRDADVIVLRPVK